MKVIFKTLIAMFIVFLTISSIPLSVSASGDIGKVDMKLKNDPSVTAESINKVLKDVGAGKSIQGKGKAIMDISKATGLNASLFMAKMMNESGWSRGSDYNKYYNYGNIFGAKGDKGNYVLMQNGVDRKPAAWSSPEAGLKGAAELLNIYYTKGYNGSKPATTLKAVLNIYAPESDNNSHDTMLSNIQSISKQFGQDLTKGGGTNSGTGSYEEAKTKETGTEVGKMKAVEDLIDFSNMEFMSPNSTGVTMGESPLLTNSLINGFTNFAQKALDASTIVVLFIIVGSIAYSMFCFTLLLAGYNGMLSKTPKLQEFGYKLMGEGNTFDRKGAIHLTLSVAKDIIFFTVILLGAYILIYAFIFEFLARFV